MDRRVASKWIGLPNFGSDASDPLRWARYPRVMLRKGTNLCARFFLARSRHRSSKSDRKTSCEPVSDNSPDRLREPEARLHGHLPA